MAQKVFSKRHSEDVKQIYLSPPIRQRLWYTISDCDPYYDPNGFNNWTICFEALPERLLREHGWSEFRSYTSQTTYQTLKNIKEFILNGIPRFVLDTVELFFDLLKEDGKKSQSSSNPYSYQQKINIVFEDANLPWRMLEGRIVKIESKWLEEEIHSKVVELFAINGFEGALSEFQQARSDLSSGDTKGAINSSNLAFESSIKALLGIEKAKPGELVRKLIDSGIVPEYYNGFLKGFEDYILRCVAVARNFEKGVGHGQGMDVNEPPKSLAELTVNLSGVLILYLLKRHLELHPVENEPEPKPEVKKDEPLF
jgi:hypothetical protein